MAGPRQAGTPCPVPKSQLCVPRRPPAAANPSRFPKRRPQERTPAFITNLRDDTTHTLPRHRALSFGSHSTEISRQLMETHVSTALTRGPRKPRKRPGPTTSPAGADAWPSECGAPSSRPQGYRGRTLRAASLQTHGLSPFLAELLCTTRRTSPRARRTTTHGRHLRAAPRSVRVTGSRSPADTECWGRSGTAAGRRHGAAPLGDRVGVAHKTEVPVPVRASARPALSALTQRTETFRLPRNLPTGVQSRDPPKPGSSCEPAAGDGAHTDGRHHRAPHGDEPTGHKRRARMSPTERSRSEGHTPCDSSYATCWKKHGDSTTRPRSRAGGTSRWSTEGVRGSEATRTDAHSSRPTRCMTPSVTPASAPRSGGR